MSLPKRLLRYLTKREPPLAVIGKESRRALDNFKESFPDYEIEYIVADLQVEIPKVKGTFQIKMRKNKEQNRDVVTAQPQEPIKMKAKRQTT